MGIYLFIFLQGRKTQIIFPMKMLMDIKQIWVFCFSTEKKNKKINKPTWLRLWASAVRMGLEAGFRWWDDGNVGGGVTMAGGCRRQR
jgi:hypothetical protein